MYGPAESCRGNEEEQLFSEVKGDAGKCPSLALAMSHVLCVMNHNSFLFVNASSGLLMYYIRDAPPSGKLMTWLLKLAYDLPLKLIIAIVIPTLFHLPTIRGGLSSHFSSPEFPFVYFHREIAPHVSCYFSLVSKHCISL